MEESNGSIIKWIFIIFGILVGFSIIGYIALIGVGFIPVTPGSPNIGNYVVSTTYSFVDNSLYWVLILALFFYLLGCYMHPRIGRGFLNIIILFALGYLNLVFLNIAPSFFGPLGTNTLLPITYSLFTSSYKTVVLYFMLIFSIILDFWGKKK